MADQRVYSDEEFALILRTAAELASRSEQPGFSSSGLTLAEIKSAAAQAGLDPALIDRAAQSLVAKATASPIERLVGGPFRHQHEARFAVSFDEDKAARALSALRLSDTHHHSSNDGHATSLGMSWRASSEGDVVSVVARPEENATVVSVVIDRRGTLIITGLVTGMAIMFSILGGMGSYNEIPTLAPWLSIAGVGASLTLARRFWAASSRKARARIGALIDAVGQALTRSGDAVHAKLSDETRAPHDDSA